MITNFEVIVVSLFGRGNWLAAELAREGMSVALLDVSRAFGHWAPEDWEGPFGVFQVENLTESQITRLHEEDYMEAVPEGFVVWTKEGTLDTVGPLASELLQKWDVSAEQVEYLKKPDPQALESFSDLNFRSSWFLRLSHHMASNSFSENTLAFLPPSPLPVFSPHYVRRASRRGYEQSLEWVASWGVTVLDKVKLVDLVWQGKQLQGFEIASDWSGVIRGEQFCWCLSSEETEHLSQTIREKIMPSGVLKSEWQWQRYRVHIEGSQIHRDIPLSTVCIEDTGLPWAHENLFVLQRAVTGSDYDMWLRLPSSRRFHRKYLEEKGQKALHFLGRRLPGCELSITQWPAEALYDAADLGPSRFPVFAAADLARTPRKAPWGNLHVDNVETWPRLDWSGMFASQSPLRAQLMQWKQKKMEALEKQRGISP
jgi:hypothetical protein